MRQGVIKGTPSEELDNSLRMKKEHEGVLRKIPKGCLVQKEIRGHKYYYLVQRVGPRVKYVYKGKVSQKEIQKSEEAKRRRAQYRNLLSRVKKQIRFLKGVLRGKEAI